MCASRLSSIDAGDRRSWGLGITLTSSTSNTDLENAAAAIGIVPARSTASPESSQGAVEDKAAADAGRNAEPAEAGFAYSLFQRLSRGVASLMSTTIDERSSQGGAKPKSQIEDMLETYYMSQGREVPEWVHNPPPDPPMNTQNTSITATAPASEKKHKHRRSAVEEATPPTPRPKEEPVRANPVQRSRTRLHIGRIIRPQLPFGLGGGSSAPSTPGAQVDSKNAAAAAAAKSPTGDLQGDAGNLRTTTPSRSSSQQAPAPSPPRNPCDSGFTSPQIQESVQASASASTSRVGVGELPHLRNIPGTPLTVPEFQLDSEQLAAGASSHLSPHSPNARNASGILRRAHTVGAQLQRSDHSVREGSPITLNSVPPRGLGNKLLSPTHASRPQTPHAPSMRSPLGAAQVNAQEPAATPAQTDSCPNMDASELNTPSELSTPAAPSASAEPGAASRSSAHPGLSTLAEMCSDAGSSLRSAPSKLKPATRKVKKLFRRKKQGQN
ncbi:hypothetical protein GQ54DRAFT_296606 [Martensiomyces pterosporus]|nr:hypothetical protein GQ54DRAFT_296606 [Martensiomyces pterosporus]